jgi:hypothetical protein
MKFYRTKVQKISKPVTSFGGIYFVNQESKNIGLPELIDTELGNRGKKGELYLWRNHSNVDEYLPVWRLFQKFFLSLRYLTGFTFVT